LDVIITNIPAATAVTKAITVPIRGASMAMITVVETIVAAAIAWAGSSTMATCALSCSS
jgi:hypothetical protein